MGLREVFEQTQRRRSGGVCTISELLDGLDGDDAVFLRELMDSEVASSRIADTLRGVGQVVGVSTIRRHRRRECMCRPSSG